MSIQRIGLHDWWSECCFSTTNAVALPFLGFVVNSGLNSAAVPISPGFVPPGVFIRSGTTANGGYRYQTTFDVFGVQKRKFRGKASWRTAFANNTARIGFHDTITITDAVDGAYFETVGAVVSAKTASNSVRTTSGTTFTMSLDVVYTFDIDVNAAGTSARFRIYADVSETAVYDQTITTNIPIGFARQFQVGIVATNSTAVATDILLLFYMGYGSALPGETMQETVFALTGTTPALDTFNGTIQTWVLTANSTPTDAMTTGQSMTLLIDDGTGFTVTWPSVTWVGGVGPTLLTAGNTVITLFKVGATLYGAF